MAGQRRPTQAPPSLAQRAVGILLGTVAVAAGVLVVIGITGPGWEYQQRAYPIMRQELASLPPYPGSQVAAEISYDRFPYLHQPDIEVSYSGTGSCADIQGYYGRIAVAQGWTADYLSKLVQSAHKNPAYDELIIRFLKARDQVNLELLVECYVQQVPADAYDLYFEAL